MSPTHSTTRAQAMPVTAPSGRAIGWTAFAAIMMIVQGGWWILSGFVGVLGDALGVAGDVYLFRFDPSMWGLIHLCAGVVVLTAGLGLFSGARWPRVVEVVSHRSRC